MWFAEALKSKKTASLRTVGDEQMLLLYKICVLFDTLHGYQKPYHPREALTLPMR
ncbi:MAG: hypothetical protein QXO32_01620 [Candidatus Bathyarchaeia archaeon]